MPLIQEEARKLSVTDLVHLIKLSEETIERMNQAYKNQEGNRDLERQMIFWNYLDGDLKLELKKRAELVAGRTWEDVG